MNKSYLENNNTIKSAFTLIEILVVVSIIGILMSLTLLGLQGSRQSTRDAKRKSDLELVRSGLELYKSDCKHYPVSSVVNLFNQTSLKGSGSPSDPASCAAVNTYISQIPKDPSNPERIYVYYSDGFTYELCSSLEKTGAGVNCGSTSLCGGSNQCNYKAINP